MRNFSLFMLFVSFVLVVLMTFGNCVCRILYGYNAQMYTDSGPFILILFIAMVFFNLAVTLRR